MKSHFLIKYMPQSGGVFYLENSLKNITTSRNDAKEYKQFETARRRAKQVYEAVVTREGGYVHVVEVNYVPCNKELPNSFQKQVDRTVYSV